MDQASTTLLRVLWNAVSQAQRSRMHLSHGQALRWIGPSGGRLAEMARLQNVSRQAMSAASRELESLGYLND